MTLDGHIRADDERFGIKAVPNGFGCWVCRDFKADTYREADSHLHDAHGLGHDERFSDDAKASEVEEFARRRTEREG